MVPEDSVPAVPAVSADRAALTGSAVSIKVTDRADRVALTAADAVVRADRVGQAVLAEAGAVPAALAVADLRAADAAVVVAISAADVAAVAGAATGGPRRPTDVPSSATVLVADVDRNGA